MGKGGHEGLVSLVYAQMLTFYWWVDVEGGNVVLVHIAVCLGN